MWAPSHWDNEAVPIDEGPSGGEDDPGLFPRAPLTLCTGTQAYPFAEKRKSAAGAIEDLRLNSGPILSPSSSSPICRGEM